MTWIVIGVVAWLVLAVAVGLLYGQVIRLRDQQKPAGEK
jgi:hypothetical protein